MTRVIAAAGHPGEVLEDGQLIACDDGAVRLTRVQREGKGPQDADDFLRGFPLGLRYGAELRCRAIVS